MNRRSFLGAVVALAGVKPALEPDVDDVCGWCMAPFDSAEHRRCRPWNCACDKVEPYGLRGIILCEPCAKAQLDRQCHKWTRAIRASSSSEWFKRKFQSLEGTAFFDATEEA